MARNGIRVHRCSLLIPGAIGVLSLALSYVAFANTYRAPVLKCSATVEKLICFANQKTKFRAKFHLNSAYPFS